MSAWNHAFVVSQHALGSVECGRPQSEVAANVRDALRAAGSACCAHPRSASIVALLADLADAADIADPADLATLYGIADRLGAGDGLTDSADAATLRAIADRIGPRDAGPIPFPKGGAA